MRAIASTLFVRDGSRRATAGFTIVELAVTMVVIAILLGSILVPLNTQVESRKYDETQRVLERAREALLGYAAANGRFPCPASASNDNGWEDFSATGNPGNGRCHANVSGTGSIVYAGFLPAATLGLAQVDEKGYALDAWGLSQNRIRYAVSGQQVLNPAPIPRPFTTTSTNTTGMRAAGMANISATPLLHICSSGTGVNVGIDCGPAANTLTTNAIVVIWSVGPNAATTNGSSTDESENLLLCGTATPRACDRIFVSKIRSGGTAGEFDDIVTWISSATVFNRLIQAGQLP